MEEGGSKHKARKSEEQQGRWRSSFRWTRYLHPSL